jgi:WD40 repeat protein
VTGECLKSWEDHEKPVYTMSVSPNTQWFCTGGGDGKFQLYDLQVRCLNEHEVHTDLGSVENSDLDLEYRKGTTRHI